MKHLLLLSLCLICSPEVLLCQPKAKGPMTIPQVVVCLPLGVDAGKTTKVTIRGVDLDKVTEIRFHDPKTTGKLLGKAKKIPVPNQAKANVVGDSEIDFEVIVPSETASPFISFGLIGEAGESRPGRLLVNDPAIPRIEEKEPNDGFRSAMPLTLPVIVEGSVKQAQDVDVFRFDGIAGESLIAEVQAARSGSPVDAILTLVDAEGRIVTTAAESAKNADPVLKVTLPKNGVYFLSLIDAHDQGGSIYVYRLVLLKNSPKKPPSEK